MNKSPSVHEVITLLFFMTTLSCFPRATHYQNCSTSLHTAES